MVTYKELITKIYKEYRVLEDDNGFTDFEKTIALDYDNLDKVVFIKELLSQNFVFNFMSTVFFNFPRLWSDLTLENWKDIVNNTARPNVRPYMDNHGCYFDLFFLNKFLHINPFVLLDDTAENKKMMMNVLPFTHFFILNEIDLENLEDGTIAITDLLEETFKKLHVNDQLVSENRDYDAFADYLKKRTES